MYKNKYNKVFKHEVPVIQKSKTYKPGRHCKHIGCGRPISMYRAGDFCFNHRGEFVKKKDRHRLSWKQITYWREKKEDVLYATENFIKYRTPYETRKDKQGRGFAVFAYV